MVDFGGSESFWGIELNQKNREAKWAPGHVEDDSSDDEAWNQRLHVKMATLGKGVSKTEEQIVEVEALDVDHTAIRIPLINMASSAHNTILTNATFSEVEQVLFRLVNGDGPIYLSGCVQANLDDDSDFSSSSSLSDESSGESSEEDDSNTSNEEKDIMKIKDAKESKKDKMKGKSGSLKAPRKRGRRASSSKGEKKRGKAAKNK